MSWPEGVLALLALCASGCSLSKTSDETSGKEPAAKAVKFKLAPEGKATCQNPIIDDVEDGNIDIPTSDQRGGFWYTYKDGAGSTLNPSPYAQASSGAHGSKGAAHIDGKIAADGVVYAGLGLHFSKKQLPYDLSSATALCFSAKGNGLARVAFPDVNTFPEGGVCKNCYNSFGKGFELTPDWQEHCFRFSELAQSPYWGDKVESFAAMAAFGVQWQTTKSGSDYDLWIDDVRLKCD